jgi:hypothetical protein
MFTRLHLNRSLKTMSDSLRKIQQDAIMYQNFIILYLYEAQHDSGDTPPIIRNLKPHWQPLVFHTWCVVGHVVGGHCQAQYNKILIHCCILMDFSLWIVLWCMDPRTSRCQTFLVYLASCKTAKSNSFVTSVHPSVCPHGTWLQQDEVLWNMVSIVKKSCYEKFKFHLKSDKYNEYFTWRPTYTYDNILNSFDVRRSVNHHTIQIIQPTRHNSFTSSLLDVYVWLNVFRASPRPSSGANNCTRSVWFYCWRAVAAALLVVVWQTTTNNAPAAALQW